MNNDKLYQAKQLHKEVWHNLRLGDYAHALPLAKKLITEFQEYPESWFAFSCLAFQVKDMKKALVAIEKAISLDPDNSEYQAHQAQCHLHLGNYDKALTMAKKVSQRKDLPTASLNILATLFHALEEHLLYLEMCQRAVDAHPSDTLLLSNLAEAHSFIGNIQKAETLYAQVIEKNPHEYTSQLNLSQLKTVTLENNHTARIEKLLLRQEIKWRGRMQLHFALGKEYEDLKEYESAFANYAAGNNLRRKNSNYDVKNDLETIALIEKTYHKKTFEQPTGYDNKEAIFVLGLPRTGTTLIERILSAHSDVFAAGELNNFSTELMRQITSTLGQGAVDKKRAVELSAVIDFKALGKNYIDSTRPRTGHTPRFIDKLPLNFLYIGLIAKALPQAKFVVLERHPMDTCFAMFKTLFGQAYPFSYDLTELGEYYCAYKQLMSHWRSVLGERILVVKYEDMVANQREQSEKLLHYCQLPWQEACFNFHQQDAGVSTASAIQVRQPIYKSSVQRWRQFEDQLSGLRSQLEAKGISIDA